MITVSAPQSGPALVMAALEAIGPATPAEMVGWYRDTFDGEPPVTDATVRQSVLRLVERGEVASVPHERGLYRLPPPDDPAPARDLGVPYEDAVRPPLHRSYAHLGKDDPEPEPLTSGPPQYAPHLTVTALYDNEGRHFADRVVCVVQHFTPYAAEVDPDGAERALPTRSASGPASPPTGRTAPASW